MLREFAGRVLLDDAATKPARKVNTLALNVGATLPEDFERFRVIAKVDADLFEDGVGVRFEQRQACFVDHFVVGNAPRDVRRRDAGPRRACRALGISSARTAGYAGVVGGRFGDCVVHTVRLQCERCGTDSACQCASSDVATPTASRPRIAVDQGASMVMDGPSGIPVCATDLPRTASLNPDGRPGSAIGNERLKPRRGGLVRDQQGLSATRGDSV